MKSRTGLIILIIIAYGFFLAWYMPANRAFAILHQGVATPLGPLKFSNLQGTWHQGVARNGQLGPLDLQEIHWQFKPWALLTGRLSGVVSVQAEQGLVAATISKGLNTVSVRNMEGSLPLRALKPLLTPLGVQLDGRVSTSLDHIAISQGRVTTIRGNVVWHDGAIISPQRAQLGTLVVELVTLEDGVRATLADSGGPLRAAGSLLLQNDGHYTMTSTLKGRTPEMQKQLDDLAFFGKKQGAGRLQFSFSGELPPLEI
ncbi:MAG: type II secretion system protein N [Desulfobulbaceae bacterium]|jgi:hypothetical protein|nr:type II secretion system protein N [Desulfobulbaceae bacterium]